MNVIMDAGHGGEDFGAVYRGRKEKDDALRLALAAGQALENQGVNVLYVRVDDSHFTSYERVAIANQAGGDYFISVHRNATATSHAPSGVEALVFENTGPAAMAARKVNMALEKVGFANLGMIQRPGLVVLRRTRMPAFLVEVGFLDNEADNQFFDQNFRAISQALAQGILAASRENA